MQSSVIGSSSTRVLMEKALATGRLSALWPAWSRIEKTVGIRPCRDPTSNNGGNVCAVPMKRDSDDKVATTPALLVDKAPQSLPSRPNARLANMASRSTSSMIRKSVFRNFENER